MKLETDQLLYYRTICTNIKKKYTSIWEYTNEEYNLIDEYVEVRRKFIEKFSTKVLFSTLREFK